MSWAVAFLGSVVSICLTVITVTILERNKPEYDETKDDEDKPPDVHLKLR